MDSVGRSVGGRRMEGRNSRFRLSGDVSSRLCCDRGGTLDPALRAIDGATVVDLSEDLDA